MRTVEIAFHKEDNFIEVIGSVLPRNYVLDDHVPENHVVKYYLAEELDNGDYHVIGFSDEIVSNLTDLKDIKTTFALAYINAKKELKDYRVANSGERGDWGTTGLHRNVEYFSFLAEQCHYLLEHDMEEHSLSFWREKAGCLNFTKFDFLGKGGYYTEYLPVQHIDVDGVDVVFDPNDVLEKAKECGVVYSTVDEMLAFANAGDLAYSEGGVAHD